MDYFKILNLNREPFSNSPEPEFFFPSKGHLACLQQLELAIRLRRGLNVVMGNVGTGKTTLCRELILRFTETEDDRNEVETHLLLDPACSAPREFLSAIALTFGVAVEAAESDWQVKENIKNHLFHKGVDEKKTIVLIIDEGQKLPRFCREILREFLNYETNENKLLQIVILAQNEFREVMKKHVNFADRVNKYYLLGPLNFRETKAMISFRLARAGRPADAPLFNFFGLWAIYRATGGYPRRIITLCHQTLLTLIIQNKVRAGWFLVRSVSRRLRPDSIRRVRWSTAGIAALLFLAFITSLFFILEPLNIILSPTPALRTTSEPTKPAGTVEPTPGQTKGDPAVTDPLVLAKQTAAAKPARELNVPTMLGRLKIHEGSTVFRLLLEIYGFMGTSRFQAVVRANPHIADMNRVRTGELIAFPAVAVAAVPWPQDGKRVRIASRVSLDEAYVLYKEYPAYLKMLPFWNPREGMVFALVMRKVFDSDAEARNAIRKLPATLAATAEIMEKPGDDTVFFAN
jgi:general secretion pathway protein A